MSSIFKPVLLLLSLTLSVSGFARTWTSTDGRTIEATLVSKGQDSVVLMLDGGKTVTVKFSQLSKEDIEFLNTTNTPAAIKGGLTLVINRYPALPPVDENAKQLNAKYVGFVKIMTPATAFKLAAQMREKIPEDLKYWEQEAARPAPKMKLKNDIRDPDVWKKNETAQLKIDEKVANAKAKVTWLKTTLPAWLTEVEKAAAEQ